MRSLINTVLTEKKAVYQSVLFGSLAGITAAGLFTLSGYIISEAALKPPLYIILFLAACLKLFGVAKSVSKYMEQLISHQATLSILNTIRMQFYERIEKITPRIFTKYRSGDLLARIVGDVESLQNYFLRVFYPPIVAAVVFLMMMIFTLFYSLWLALAVFVCLLIMTVLLPTLLLKAREKSDQQKAFKRSELSTETTELLYGYRDLTLSNTVDKKIESLMKVAEQYDEEQQKEANNLLKDQAINLFFASLTVAIVLFIGAYLVTIGRLNGLYLAMLVLLTLTVLELAIPMINVPHYARESENAMLRLQEVTVSNADEENTQKQINMPALFSFSMQEVEFNYENSAHAVIHNMNFVLPQGSRTAIIGASGSGKSTILNLLLGINEPTNGKVRVAGRPLEEWQKEELWDKITIVLQQNHFFYGTIEDNLKIAKPNATKNEMEQALSDMELPFSLTTKVYEKGENLSGGEKQRLALARMWLKNSAVWLLDEPFSALDPATAARICQKIMRKTMDKTLLIISHRLQGLEKMDQILVINEGQLLESGTHIELLQKQGQYYALTKIEENSI